MNFRNGTVYEVISIIIKYTGLSIQDSSVMEDSVRITKLKGMENWPLWKFQMRVILASSEVGSIVSGDWTRPSPKITRTSEKETDEEAKLRWQNQINNWKKADSKCQKLIVTSIDDGPLQYLINCETAFEMWEKLLSIYEQKSEASIHLLQQKFFSYSKDPMDDISTHISKLENLGRKLSLAGEPITDNMVMTKILMTLPKDYQHFYSAWDSIPTGSKTVNNLTSRLLIEESRIQQIKGEVGDQEKSSAFSAKFQNKSSGKRGSYSKNKKELINTNNKLNCFYCGKKGHFKRDCKSYLRSMELKKTSTSDSNENAFISESTLNNTTTDMWVLDSGASDHMCAKLEWFSSYEPLVNTQHITIGDGSNLYATGKGNINIVTYINGNWKRNYLANVLHVPDLKFNLFSCGTSLDKGLKLNLG